VANGVRSVNTTAPAWTSPTLDGQLYGQPLVATGDVFVATENDTVYALSATTGAVVWSAHVATAVPSSSLPCGDISPTVGITGTPVIDPTRHELFAVADELVHGNEAHVLVGVSTETGTVLLSQPVDASGADPATHLQRTGLALDHGNVVFGFGGNYGDCGEYHGRVVSVPEGGGTPVEFTVDSANGDDQGAVWMGGAAPVVDSIGDVWVTSGNGSVTTGAAPYDHSDAVLELTPALTVKQFFAPTTWAADNATDLDFSTAPAVMASQVIAAGKSDTAYLLDSANLGGIGGEQAKRTGICPTDVDGGVAFSNGTVYLPCLTGPVAVESTTSPPALHVVWSAHTGGGPPIVAGGLVWTIGRDGTLFGLNETTGAVVQKATVGVPANHFPTPGVGDGLLLATSATRVVAFTTTPKPAAQSAATTSSTTASSAVTPATTGAVPTTTPSPRTSGTPVGVWVLVGLALAVLVGGALYLLLRWRRPKGPGP
jgi:outer membrane protein assembly factor BamB